MQEVRVPRKNIKIMIVVVGLIAIGLSVMSLQKASEPELVTAVQAAEGRTNQSSEYQTQVQPILHKRCVVCHGCYDAPCQLKLSSATGVIRGANKDKVYNGTRLLADPLTRLYIDADSEAEWRKKEFYPVLAKSGEHFSTALIAKFLNLKQSHPLPAKPNMPLPGEHFDLSLNREQSCPTNNEFQNFAKDKPYSGMPYGLVNIPEKEQVILNRWLASNTLPTESKVDVQVFSTEIASWENFLNQHDNKGQLVARYIYEHLFLANIYLQENDQPQYFKLVRSLSPPGQPIKRIATRRPFDAPSADPDITGIVKRVYYRLWPVPQAIVAKNHIPYLLDENRMNRWRALFFEPDYQVTSLPGYEKQTAANPFKTFAQLPHKARYRFMLEHSKFTIRGFMKGAVCRGQVALNVINDHFWVFFVDPEQPLFNQLYREIPHHIENLNLPAELDSNAGLLAHWTRYSKQQANYLKSKSQLFAQASQWNKPQISWVWDGDNKNPNAALTVFRHFDSASVVQGLVGNEPKTVWLIDYPILERIHYLLVAGFDVYGNVGHQLATRMYMDFLRMESEFNFLSLLPESERLKLRDHWYRDVRKRVKDYVYGNYAHLDSPPAIEYPEGAEPKPFLLQQLKKHLQKVLSERYQLDTDVEPAASLLALQKAPQNNVSLMPEMGLLMLTENNEISDVYTFLRTSSHNNITSLFLEKSNRLPEEDYLTIMPGIVGAYPDALWQVEREQVGAFMEQVNQLKTEDDYAALMSEFGIRRSHPEFWQISDRLHEFYRTSAPIEYGIFDYMRIENR